MFPWIWFQPTFNFPFSGDVAQDIEPRTIWDLPFSGPYRGNRPLERRILAEGAGYGEQLKVLHAAVLALIDHLKVEKLEGCKEAIELHRKIDDIKTAHYAETASDLRTVLIALKKADENAFEALLDDLSKVSPVDLGLS
jgi:hypothetical protein